MPITRALNKYKAKSYTGSSTIAGTTTESEFSLQHTIRANNLKVGQTYRFTGFGVYSTIAASAGTEQFTFRLGSTTIVAQAAFTATVNKVNCMVTFDVFMTTTAVGGSGSIEAQGRLFSETVNGGGQWFSLENTAPITLDTTIDQTFKLAFKWSVADPGNAITLRQLVVEELG